MGAATVIEWTDATWTPIRARNLKTGKVGWYCEHVSPGCVNCYAESMNRRLGTGLSFKPGHRRDIEIFLDEEMLTAPLRWRKPRMIFVCSMTDLFADFVKNEWIDRVFAVMALSPQHTYQVLTKRPARMRAYLANPAWFGRVAYRLAEFTHMTAESRSRGARTAGLLESLQQRMAPLPKVWLGTSVEDQARADERIPHLLQTPAAVRFISAEPLLGPIVLPPEFLALGKRGWVIAGGESGRDARPMHPDRARLLRDQCVAAGVPFFFKQWGEWAPFTPEVGGNLGDMVRRGEVEIVQRGGEDLVTVAKMTGGRSTLPGARYMRRAGKRAAGRLLNGREWNEMPGESQ